jgi:O-antigen/teichoic acid export membrane protein
MFWHVGAAAIAFALGAVMLWRARPHEIKTVRADYSAASNWWRAAIPLTMITGLQVISNQSGIVLLGILRSREDVALFKVAMSAAVLMTIGIQITNMIISPHVARLHAIQDRRRLARLAALGSVGGTAVSLPLFMIFLLAGEPLLSLFYGAEYVAAFSPLVILAGAQIVNVAFGSTGVLLSMTGYESLAASWLAVSAAFNVLLSLILIPPLGIHGAAWASALSVVVWNFAFWIIARKKLGIDGSVLSIIVRRRDEEA